MAASVLARFSELFHRFFPGAELPIAFYYTDSPVPAAPPRASGDSCIICELRRVRAGETLCLEAGDIACGGGRRYLGFSPRLGDKFRYFLSCGIPGEMEGERYKKSPELVDALVASRTPLVAPARYIVWKRWDRLEEGEQPEVVVFFAWGDVLSGLFTLAGFDDAADASVVAPFGSGCASIVEIPLREAQTTLARAVIGMFDVSARPCVEPNVLTFAVPWRRFVRMVNNADESFLITGSWERVRQRISQVQDLRPRQ